VLGKFKDETNQLRQPNRVRFEMRVINIIIKIVGIHGSLLYENLHESVVGGKFYLKKNNKLRPI
jgi:hypothetical protein